VEWTNQHGCGSGHEKVNCQIVLQFMCDDDLRDGTTNNRIPDDEDEYNKETAAGEKVYGMHENYQYYQSCKTRSRNRGLFTADRNVRRDATGTRQNNNGNRSGFECPEERDYYPYWHPTPWRDIAIMTEDTDRCKYYRRNSENRRGRNFCTNGEYNNKGECEANQGVWLRAESHKCPGTPDCIGSQWSRVNHLGNVGSSQANGGADQGHNGMYNWTIPSCIEHEHCVLRIRYNISTNDYDGWSTDSKSNGQKSPVKQDPYLRFATRNLSLAIATNQFGRTFQDRSHSFAIRRRPGGVGDGKRIFLLSVRGKRGNIVQTYPATEYDFAPSRLQVRKDDYVHFTWTGCDNNPNGNDGEGTRRTDRSNMVPMTDSARNMFEEHSEYGGEGSQFLSEEDATRAAHLDLHLLNQCDDATLDGNNNDQDDDNLDVRCCATLEQLQNKHGNNRDRIDRSVYNCAKLNPAGRKMDLGLIKVGKKGVFKYMSSRNNNFTNRSQKGVLVSQPILPTWAVALLSIGGVGFLAGLGFAGATVYAAKNPGSGVADLVAKVGGGSGNA